ncbi:MAG: phage gp6-like head-tail connector protein [Bacteroidales bacterium]|nr:phage gp6-like head-tail connector protein [Bacteroidales bacterium]
MLADNALTTLERLKTMLGLWEEEDEKTDAMLEMLINKASAWVERQVGRSLAKKEYVHWFYADGQQELTTLEYPITEVHYVKQDGALVDPSTYDYGQTAGIGVIYRDKGWMRAGYRRGLANDIVETKRCIEVSYSAGYVLPKDATEEDPQTLPADLEGLVWEMASQAFANMMNGSEGLKSFSISDVRWDFDKSVHAEWTQLLNLYKRY